ncbi:diphosphomevalonate/mevalonate 3,5-bisphosphate decarboxylase family protein [Flavicella sediminum]|uniref:diphosphomevalonate/mevalonate 3,5-bisphosphate decarboxylase family protein n=1 Tax=Flavicella sediminum TaxID=2585141 RepID=UPI0011235D3C|nr:diphosphomevalonate decarboxylase [Flavicella sediminum]
MTEDFKEPIPSLQVAQGSVAWQTPSNIALVKYWGKRDPQLPENPSISFTLKNCHTNTKVDFVKRTITDGEFSFDIIFEGEKKEAFKPKIQKFFERIQEYVPFVSEYHFTITSDNSFPHSSGIASSASGMSALSMCLMSIEKQLNPEISETYFYRKASFLARLGSGSACRSVKGNLVVWGAHPEIAESSDLYGVPFSEEIAPIFENYQDTILLVDKGEKQVSSTVGHQLMHGHPYAASRFSQAVENISKIKTFLKSGAIKEFIALVESEALTLHAMMMTSQPYFILMKPNTLEIINKIWAYRAENDSNICFTLDAGANVHLLYPENEKEKVHSFIETELSIHCQNNHFIHDELGYGAKEMK